MFLSIKIVKNYAQSLFLQAKKIKKEAQIFNDIQYLNDNILSDDRLREIMISPILEFSTKIRIINVLNEKAKFEKISQNFFHILIKNGRIELLGAIVDEFDYMIKEQKNIKSVQLSSCNQLSAKETYFIKQLLEYKLGKEIEIDSIIDKTLLGGVVIKYDSIIIDCSLQGALNKIEQIIR